MPRRRYCSRPRPLPLLPYNGRLQSNGPLISTDLHAPHRHRRRKRFWKENLFHRTEHNFLSQKQDIELNNKHLYADNPPMLNILKV